MFWILTASVPGDDRVFTIGSKAEFPEPRRGRQGRITDTPTRAVFVTPATSMPLHWRILHLVRHLLLLIRLLLENVQENAFVVTGSLSYHFAPWSTPLHPFPTHRRPAHRRQFFVASQQGLVICVGGASGGNQYSFKPFCPMRGVPPSG